MLVLITSTPSIVQELRSNFLEKEAEIVQLATCLENKEHEKTNKVSSSKTVITLQDNKKLIV